MNNITCVNIAKEYEGGVIALQEANLEICRGEIVVFAGPSGSGKTTFINILGLLDNPTAGAVYMDGKQISMLPEAGAKKIISENYGFIFQFFNLLPELTVVENVMLPLWIKEKSPLKLKSYYERAEQLLSEFGILKRKDFFPSSLSGGEMQRAAICRSLICEPDVIFADEPTGSIDRKSSEIFFELLRELNVNRKVTFIIGTHNEKFLQFASKVVYLDQGRIEKIDESRASRD